MSCRLAEGRPMQRFGLRDDQWDRIKDFLPGREGHVGGTAADNRLFVDAVTSRSSPEVDPASRRFRTAWPWRRSARSCSLPSFRCGKAFASSACRFLRCARMQRTSIRKWPWRCKSGASPGCRGQPTNGIPSLVAMSESCLMPRRSMRSRARRARDFPPTPPVVIVPPLPGSSGNIR